MKDAQDAVKEIREWPKLTQDYLVEHHDGSIGFVNELPPVLVCGRGEFMEAKAGKPSWSMVMDSHKWMAQDSDGEWCSFIEKPEIDAAGAEWVGRGMMLVAKGTVLGDWRDTLERRPEAEPVVNTDGDQILNYYMPLPGEECECWDGEEWHLGVSVGPYMNGWLCMLPTIERPFIGSHGDFRPLKSDRERWKEAAETIWNDEAQKAGDPFGAIYDTIISGELPMPEKD